MSLPACEVLLATYNGARFLPALLESLFAQGDADFTLIVRDDCSADGTPALLAAWAERHPGRIRILPSPPRRQGACANFAALVDAAGADRLFFCDQDDVWLPGKMAESLAEMDRLVARHGRDAALLVHTDLAVVDEDLRPLGGSFCRYAAIDPARNAMGELLLGNVATGCTMLVNRALLDAARPVPAGVLMYDHWFAQVAATVGHIAFIDRPTVLYRQHGGNVVGVEPAGAGRFLRSIVRTLLTDDVLKVLRAYSHHAAVLDERFGQGLDPARRRQLQAMASVWSLPRHRRMTHLLRAGLRKPSLAGNVAMALLLLRDPA
jgi:Glycosyl transferase family 2